MIIKANPKFPAITAQNVGRELYHRRQELVIVLGERQTLQTVAWILAKVPDMFAVRLKGTSLLVRRIEAPQPVERLQSVAAPQRETPPLIATHQLLYC